MTTGIEWTDETWNPIVGCSLVSPGCTNCYAMKFAGRVLDQVNSKARHYAGTTTKVKGNSVWTGKVALAPDHILRAPLTWKKPRKIFVNSMGDLFHESVPDEWVDKVFAVMALCPQHTFQILTKRSKRMREVLSTSDIEGRVAIHMFATNAKIAYENSSDPWWPLSNVWLGVSAEDQTRADERIPDLLATPAAIRFVSAEPLLGPIDFWAHNPPHHQNIRRKLDWIIVGGESGPNARPMHPDWARSIRDQCEATGTAFFFKQWGEWAPGENCDFLARGSEQVADWINGQWSYGSITRKQSEETHIEDEPDLYRVGKAKAGRLLDSKLHNQFPEVK
jgi:protein gp37